MDGELDIAPADLLARQPRASVVGLVRVRVRVRVGVRVGVRARVRVRGGVRVRVRVRVKGSVVGLRGEHMRLSLDRDVLRQVAWSGVRGLGLGLGLGLAFGVWASSQG